MLVELEQLLTEVSNLNTKLILLVGRNKSAKTKQLLELATKLHAERVNLGKELGKRLASLPISARSFSAGELLKEIANHSIQQQVLLLDNLEVLFEPSLQTNPLDLIKRIAHSRPVVAVWPGDHSNGRLLYADISHPEHQDYNSEGVVLFEI